MRPKPRNPTVREGENEVVLSWGPQSVNGANPGHCRLDVSLSMVAMPDHIAHLALIDQRYSVAGVPTCH